MILTPRPFLKECRFEPEGHQYFGPGGEILPSVTTILKAEGINRYSNGPSVDSLMQIGTWVHDMVRMFEKGTLDEDALAVSMRGYLESYRTWKATAGMTPLVVEQSLFSQRWKYAGTPDIVGALEVPAGLAAFAVVDLKTGSLRAGDRIQVAGYMGLAQECYVELEKEFMAGRVVYLRSDGGSPRVEQVDELMMEDGLGLFREALHLNRWKAANK
jgi:hypothetical protein